MSLKGASGRDAAQAAKEAMERLLKQQQERAEQVRQQQAQQRSKQTQPLDPKTVEKPDQPCEQVVDKATFVNDAKVQEQLQMSKEELSQAYDKAAALDNHDGMSSKELNALFLSVASNTELKPEQPATEAKPEQPGQPEAKPEDAPKTAEQLKTLNDAVDQAKGVLAKNGMGEDSPAFKRYEAARKNVANMVASGQGDPKAMTELTNSSLALVQELRQKAGSGADEKLKAATDTMLANIAQETKASSDLVKKAAGPGTALAKALGPTVNKLGALYGAVNLIAALSSGKTTDGKELDAADVLQAPKQIHEALADLAGDEGGELGNLAKSLARGMESTMETVANKLGPKTAQAYQAVSRFVSQVYQKAASLGEGAKDFIAKATKGVDELIEKAGTRALNGARTLLGEEAVEMIAAHCGQAAAFLEGADLAVLGATAVYQGLNMCLQGGAQFKAAYTQVMDDNRRTYKANETLTTLDANEEKFNQDAKTVAEQLKQPGGQALRDQVAADAERANATVMSVLSPSKPYPNQNDMDPVPREETAKRLQGQQVTLPDGTKADAGALFQRLADYHTKQPLTKDEQIALAGPLAKAAREVTEDQMITAGRSDFDGMPARDLTPERAQAMNDLQLKSVLGSMPPEKLDQVPQATRLAAYDRATEGVGGALESQFNDTIGKVVGAEDHRRDYMGLLMASNLRTMKPPANATPEQVKAAQEQMKAFVDHAIGSELPTGGVFSNARADVVAECVKGMKPEDLQALPPEALKQMAAQTSQNMQYANNANVETSMKLAAALRATGHAEDAKAIEDRFGGLNADNAATMRVKAMSDEELRKMDSTERENLMKAIAGQRTGVLSEAEAQQAGRLLSSSVPKDFDALNKVMVDAANGLTGIGGANRVALISHSMVNGIADGDLKNIPADQQKVLADQIIGTSGSVYDAYTQSAVRLANSLRQDHQADKVADDIENRAKGTILGTKADNVARMEIDPATPEQLRGLSLDRQKQMMTELMSNGSAESVQSAAKLLGVVVGTDGKAGNPDEAARRYRELMDAVPEGKRYLVAQALAKNTPPEALAALPKPVKDDLSEQVGKGLDPRWNGMAHGPDEFESAYKMLAANPDGAQALQKQIDGAIANTDGLNSAEPYAALGRLRAMTSEERDALAKDPAKLGPVLKSLDNHTFSNGDQNVMIAEMINRSLAQIPGGPGSKDQDKKAQAQRFKELIGQLSSGSQSPVTATMLAGKDHSAMVDAYSYETRDAIVEALNNNYLGGYDDQIMRVRG